MFPIFPITDYEIWTRVFPQHILQKDKVTLRPRFPFQGTVLEANSSATSSKQKDTINTYQIAVVSIILPIVHYESVRRRVSQPPDLFRGHGAARFATRAYGFLDPRRAPDCVSTQRVPRARVCPLDALTFTHTLATLVDS